ncbi:putative HAMP linker domain-containing nitrate/nitrite-sensing histidine kinase [Nocardia nova SH22a]|uniref:histidine kinase n=1 Tax=Nocardia nova SH22a TaxID=1415166 RepID=W5TLB1_9NOCA|nr:putative HAMP linker domain-containing nitrate/nitrite-sensing histidine kinase [Nocardia nova SH22a]
MTAVQNERSSSLAVLSGDSSSIPKLQAQRSSTDAALAEIDRVIPEAQRLAPGAPDASVPDFVALVASTPKVRESVDRGETNTRSVDDFYKRLDGVLPTGLQILAKSTPDSLTATKEITAANLFDMAELHSRASALGSAGIVGGRLLTSDERRTVTQLVGGYRNQLDSLTPQLSADGRARLDRLTHSAEWKTATESEDLLADRGTIEVPYAEWRSAEQFVDSELIGLFRDHLYDANAQASVSANQLLNRSIAAGFGIALIAISAFLLALTLANRLVRRLHSLHTRSMELADETLPAIVRRIHDGEQVDVAAETAVLDTGRDEIGQVARAFGAAQRTAMVAAVEEARTREGFNRVFLDIAHRSQVLVRRQLDVLDIAEANQQDPEQLELLFQLDHLATRARRNAENLLLLGGEQPGRRWKDPIALEQVVRSAFSETNDLTRMSAIRLPEVRVLGLLVADLIHLLAELIDNSMQFSPPHSVVSVHGNPVGRGIAIEIEDQGLGIRFDERERLNRLLHDPPEFQEMALAGQRNLGLFVVGRLAKKHAITVNLQESAYGGVKAIVLVPSHLLAGTQPRAPLPHRHRQTHLAPQLQSDNAKSRTAEPRSAEHRRPAEEVRRAMSSFQSGTAQARSPFPPTNK